MVVGDQMSIFFEKETAALGDLFSGFIVDIDCDRCAQNFSDRIGCPAPGPGRTVRQENNNGHRESEIYDDILHAFPHHEEKRDDVVEALVDMVYGSAPYLIPAAASPAPGDPLLVAGSPLGVARVTSRGKVIQIAVIPELGKCIVHDAHATHGSSGGPVVNPEGEVIGMETAGLVGRPNVDFAIPVERFSGLTSCYRQLETLEALRRSNAASGVEVKSSNIRSSNIQ